MAGGMAGEFHAWKSHAFVLETARVSPACQNRVEALGRWRIHAEIMLSPVECNACLPDSSSGSLESNLRIPKSLRPGGSGAYMPKVYFLLGGGGESMCESEFSPDSSIVETGSC